jgi:hypothetical protein
VAATDTVDLIATLSRLCDGFNLSRARKDTIREWLVSMLGGLREDRRQPRTEAAAWCTDNGKPSWPGLDPAIHGLGQTENGAGQSYKDERFRCRRPTGQYRTVFCVFWRVDGRVNPRIVSGDRHDAGQREPQGQLTDGPDPSQSIAKSGL